jgi:recombination protein RecT
MSQDLVTIQSTLQGMSTQFAEALPKILNTERFLNIAMTSIRQNPKLMECTQESLLGALLTMARDGLEPGPNGHCYLIPRWNGKTKKMDVSYQRGYQGVLELTRRSGELAHLEVKAVHENDQFDYQEGTETKLVFKRALANRGAIICYYCLTKTKAGDISFTILSQEEAIRFRDTFASSKNKQGEIYGPWKDDFEAMAKKTVIIHHLKYLPKASEDLRALTIDDRTYTYDPETHQTTPEPPEQLPGHDVISPEKLEEVQRLIDTRERDSDELTSSLCAAYKISELSQLAGKQIANAIGRLEAMPALPQTENLTEEDIPF